MRPRRRSSAQLPSAKLPARFVRARRFPRSVRLRPVQDEWIWLDPSALYHGKPTAAELPYKKTIPPTADRSLRFLSFLLYGYLRTNRWFDAILRRRADRGHPPRRRPALGGVDPADAGAVHPHPQPVPPFRPRLEAQRAHAPGGRPGP